jgi:hypothetical protein
MSALRAHFSRGREKSGLGLDSGAFGKAYGVMPPTPERDRMSTGSPLGRFVPELGLQGPQFPSPAALEIYSLAPEHPSPIWASLTHRSKIHQRRSQWSGLV